MIIKSNLLSEAFVCSHSLSLPFRRIRTVWYINKFSRIKQSIFCSSFIHDCCVAHSLDLSMSDVVLAIFEKSTFPILKVDPADKIDLLFERCLQFTKEHIFCKYLRMRNGFRWFYHRFHVMTSKLVRWEQSDGVCRWPKMQIYFCSLWWYQTAKVRKFNLNFSWNIF